MSLKTSNIFKPLRSFQFVSKKIDFILPKLKILLEASLCKTLIFTDV